MVRSGAVTMIVFNFMARRSFFTMTLLNGTALPATTSFSTKWRWSGCTGGLMWRWYLSGSRLFCVSWSLRMPLITVISSAKGPTCGFWCLASHFSLNWSRGCLTWTCTPMLNVTINGK
ncbi:hypothetical protein H257_19287 [Aphanomyces astaci]|uniref:Uncharacterized protein n=1 Tax=Aphanomyces astaci TaxID=112090 RepID=W4F8H3_APHAT|nr:hypothetical protein H257_19287 [Aphanomyces astaci]ETV63780.1 hypothetical protein H257_19287 [Aphanomyces astaci]|eukprot:XP_009846734.1 hypothetical protein H257_19287 [Aphanomyces astaci]